MKKNILAAALALTLVSATATSALAEGFALTDWSARGAALAGGLVARGGDASAIAYNPAAIARLEGTQIMMGTDSISPRTTIIGERGTQNNASKWYLAPHFYVSHRYSDRLSFGVGLYSRFGLGNKYANDWMGKYNLQSVDLQTSTFSPVVAYRLTDSFSVAAGLEISGAMMTLKKAAYTAPLIGFDNAIKIKGNGASLGAVLGVHFQPNDSFSMGLTYHSRMRIHVTGDSTWTKEFPGTVMSNAKINGDLKLPDQIALGVAWKPLHNLSFEADLSFYSWSIYKNLDMYFKAPINALNPSPKNWKNTYTFAISAEYRPIEPLALRLGYYIENSPVDLDYADYLAPVNGRQRFTVGAGYTYKNWTIDLAYIYTAIRSLHYNDTSVEGITRGRSHKTMAHSALITVGYKF